MRWMCEVFSICLGSCVNVYGGYLWVRMDNDRIRTIDAMVIFHLNQSNPYRMVVSPLVTFLIASTGEKVCPGAD